MTAIGYMNLILTPLYYAARYNLVNTSNFNINFNLFKLLVYHVKNDIPNSNHNSNDFIIANSVCDHYLIVTLRLFSKNLACDFSSFPACDNINYWKRYLIFPRLFNYRPIYYGRYVSTLSEWWAYLVFPVLHADICIFENKFMIPLYECSTIFFEILRNYVPIYCNQWDCKRQKFTISTKQIWFNFNYLQ